MALDGSNHITITWPCDCASQKAIIKTMLTDIEAQDTLIRSKGRKQLQIFSKNPPSLAQWQTEWLLRGNSLPLPTGLELLWFDTTGNTYGAQYYVVSGVVYPVEMLRYRGIKNIKRDTDSETNIGVTLGTSTTGLPHWSLTDNGTGNPGAVSYLWNIPTHLIGKNYFFKVSVPFLASGGTALNWTIWYEGTNFYNTLFGGTGQSGFGAFPTIAIQNVVEWTAEIPAGGVVTTIEVRVAYTSGSGSITDSPKENGGTGSQDGRAIAEFILKTE